MNCEQKSGVFLNKSCERLAANTCSNCEKQVCEVHFHHFETADLCETCYWERYMYAIEVQDDDYIFDDTTDRNSSSTSDYSPSSSSSSSRGEGFGGGFGGGGFGGGGASGEWTKGDADGFNETDANGGLLDSDDTFYYS